jgi:uncharacterized protein
MSNRLIHEHSPYLQQHAHNPVDWYPWGEDAFRKAQNEHKPIFLSIGYSACHWCHVMERESFEDEAIAEILNAHFVSIKVDREERPDIDKHFQKVYQLMNGRPGGWPTSIFLTEERKPFYSATYLPPEPRHGLMAFGALLETIHARYESDHALLTKKAEEILDYVVPQRDKIEATRLDRSIVDRFVSQAAQLFDDTHGGFRGAPKFPQTSSVDLLLIIDQLTDDPKSRHRALFTLKEMAKGGMYDRVEGGFCRYSTDEWWLVPHFEKMTYDNALLATLYLHAYELTHDTFYRSVAFETLEFMLDKMSQDGLFFSASDADTESEEGKYFIYSYDEATKALEAASIPSTQTPQLMAALGITRNGNFEGRNIVRIENLETLVGPYYARAIEALRSLRKQRTYPSIDNKILVSWNAMMIKALFRAGYHEPRYRAKAKESLEALTQTMVRDETLYHSTLIGKAPKIEAFLEDYAYLADAYLEGYQATYDETMLMHAIKLANHALAHYYDGGLWKFSKGEFVTEADIHDSSYPSALAVMLSVLQDLSSLVDPSYGQYLYRTLEIHSYDLMRQPVSSPSMTQAVIRYLYQDILIKAPASRLQKDQPGPHRSTYPFALLKAETGTGYQLCTPVHCFAQAESWTQARQALTRYLLENEG